MSRGFTLVELLATLAILGMGASVAALALPALRPTDESAVVRSLAEARSRAVRSGEAVTWRGDSAAVRFLPDGSSSGGTATDDTVTIVVDRLTGATHATR